MHIAFSSGSYYTEPNKFSDLSKPSGGFKFDHRTKWRTWQLPQLFAFIVSSVLFRKCVLRQTEFVWLQVLVTCYSIISPLPSAVFVLF